MRTNRSSNTFAVVPPEHSGASFNWLVEKHNWGSMPDSFCYIILSESMHFRLPSFQNATPPSPSFINTICYICIYCLLVSEVGGHNKEILPKKKEKVNTISSIYAHLCQHQIRMFMYSFLNKDLILYDKWCCISIFTTQNTDLIILDWSSILVYFKSIVSLYDYCKYIDRL